MAERGPLKRHISKSASDLSERGRLAEDLGRADAPQASSSSGPANSAQSVPQLSVAQKTHSFFNTLKIRWSRSRSRERRSKRKFRGDGWAQKESGSTDYGADNSSDHSSSATQSPQHRASVQQHAVDPSPLARPPENEATQKSQPRPPSAGAILPSLPIFPTTSEKSKSREAILCQHSFFQLRIHLKRGVDLIARDKGGTSDPYVKFKIGGRLLYKSKTIYRDLNPVWDEIFTIPIEDAFVPVHIKVFDYDWGLQDDFMGSAYLDLTKIDLGKPTELQLELLDPGKTGYLGMLYLTVTLLPKTQEDKDLEGIWMQRDFGTIRKVKKTLVKLRSRDRDDAEDLPEDSDKEANRRKLKQKLMAVLEKVGEEIFEDGEVARAKLKQRVSRLSERLLRAGKDEPDLFEDLQESGKRYRIMDRLARLTHSKTEEELSDEEDNDEEEDNSKSVSGKLLHKINKLSERLKKEDEPKMDPPCAKDAQPAHDDTLSDTESKLATKVKEHPDGEATDSDDRMTERSKWKKGMQERLRKEDGTEGTNSEDEREGRVAKGLRKFLSKSDKWGCESSDTDRSQGKPDTTDLEVKILEKLSQKLKERGSKVQRYFQRTGRIGDMNRRLKSQIWSSVVTIVLVEGKNLQPMDIDGYSDPYVKFRLGNEKYKSKVVYKNLNPSWLEQFDFHLYDDQTQELEVTVWDKDKSKDDFMGRCSIDLSSLEREKTHGLWQELEEGGGCIHLLLTISGTTASETISDLTTYEDNVRERRNIERRYALKNSLHNLRDVGHLTVKVYRATGLAAADLGGKSDPFCVLELVNARLQTQTEYKTLSPSWQKIFTFNVKDINSVLEVTVYDEDRDHKVEFLGKVVIPLLRIKNGEKRWYCLKDKKLHGRAKGNCPMILLEMYVVWNPVRACIRTLNPKEEKYMQGEVKFKRQVFVRNVLRLKAIVMIIIGWGKMIQDCFEWERPAQSATALVLFIALCYYFEPFMIPVALLLVFLKYYIVLWLTGGKASAVDEEEVYGEDEDDDEEKDKEEKKSLKERLQAIQEVTQTVQNAIGHIASLGEQVKNTFNFTVPFVTYLAIGLTLAAAVVMYLIPVRYLIMIAGVNKFARKLLRPHTIPNNEVLDLLSRVPDDEDLIAYREFRPYTSNEVDKRREQRKKHKTS